MKDVGMYKIYLGKQAVKVIKRRGEKFKKKINNILQLVTKNPNPAQSERLSGELSFIHSLHFNFAGTMFRLAYVVDEKAKRITIVLIGPRENFYSILRQKLV